jgi:hypothetical protein
MSIVLIVIRFVVGDLPMKIFTWHIVLGTSCSYNSTICGPSMLSQCSPSLLTCQCSSSFMSVSYADMFYCADTFNTSNCQIFPTRCITWCNSTTNSLCICPSGTLRIERDNLYLCELPVNAFNCSIQDPIRRCPLGQCCTIGQCRDCSATSSFMTTIVVTSNANSSE